MSEANPTPDLPTLRSYWEFAAISQFLHLFFEAYHLEEFVTEVLEEQILSPWPPSELIDLHVKMLKVMTQNRLISPDTWVMYFRKEVLKRYMGNTIFPEEYEYKTLPLYNKVLVLYSICEWQCDNPDRFRQAVKNEEECNHWRVDPVGWDAAGNTYWLFDDNRLYKEEKIVSKKRKGDKPIGVLAEEYGRWSVECITIQDWLSFPDKFSNSRNQSEKKFYQFLTVHALPQVLPDLEEKEKKKKQQEAILNRKRSTRLQMREVSRLEEEKIALFDRDRRIKGKSNGGFDSMDDEMWDSSEDTRRLRRRKTNPPPPKVDPAVERELRAARRRGDTAYVPKEREERSRRKVETEEHVSTNGDEAEPSNWYFRCSCGLEGENLDDGLPMIACGQCQRWQHVRCAALEEGLPEDTSQDEWEHRDFLCASCRSKSNGHNGSKKEEDVNGDVEMDPSN
ncbi:hypothetical protein HDU97_004990 [Phlyctochytrium planicorne]|nr:hypothetical protein HDU97_004990 [Phlyctochytrium planicorne]